MKVPPVPSHNLDRLHELERRYEIDADTAAVLDRFGFDAELFDQLRTQAATSQVNTSQASANQSDGGPLDTGPLDTGPLEVVPPSSEDLLALPEPGSDAHAELAATGAAAIAAGEVAVLVLAGGLAGRFGGANKALSEAVDSVSFIDAKLSFVAALAERLGELARPIDFWLMTSFATHDDLCAWSETKNLRARGRATSDSAPPKIACAPQSVMMRISPDGELHRPSSTDSAQASLYAPGHGDAPEALERAGLLERFRTQGGRYIFVSNVDNIAATLDPTTLGAHIASARPITCEVVRQGSPAGGAPWLADSRLQIIEEFRLTSPRRQLRNPYANTNSLTLDIEVLETGGAALSWFTHALGGFVQFERHIAELTAHFDTTMLLVPTEGDQARFLPVKTMDDLAKRRDQIRRLLQARR